MKPHLWLRAENKALEKRTPLTPDNAGQLLQAGFEISVESSSQRIFEDSVYADAGCNIVAGESWQHAPAGAIILGLKELPESVDPISHRHIYFAHAYKYQQGWQAILRRFRDGGGSLLDIEFLTDADGRRVAAFGFWAGFAGAAVAVKNWCHQQRQPGEPMPAVTDYADKAALIEELGNELRAVDTSVPPRVMVIGARGRSGSGAVQLARELGLPTTGWDLEETRAGGPFREILAHEIFINCVLVFDAVPPFLTEETLQDERILSVISDVSCDPYGNYNPLPIYRDCTTFNEPGRRLRHDPVLDLIAIDHLPSMLPRESSEDFSDLLLPSLFRLGDTGKSEWSRAEEIFNDKLAEINSATKT